MAAIAQKRRNARAAVAPPVPKIADPESYRPAAAFFAQLRQYLGLTREQAAFQLQTYPAVIAALETGTLSDLPPWPQTRLIVWRYASLAGIDPAPAIHSLEDHFYPSAVAVQNKDDPDPANSARKIESARKTLDLTYLASKLPRRWPVWRITAVASVLLLAGVGTQSTMLEAAIVKLPAPVAGVIRQMKNALHLKSTRTFEGMTWIDVDNPRTRRADKLPTKRR
ncbi:MAG: helix-turn-helix domain-containing protein [Hyphomicrobiaceae bacterium]